jgi:hypothetical protein
MTGLLVLTKSLLSTSVKAALTGAQGLMLNLDEPDGPGGVDFRRAPVRRLWDHTNRL